MIYNGQEQQKTKITAEQWGRKVSIELGHSDTDIHELMELFKGITLGLGYTEDVWNVGIAEMAGELYDEISEEDIDAAIAEHNSIEALDR